MEENHLRWDSLGEFLALAESLRFVGRSQHNDRATVLADALDRATSVHLDRDLSPRRKAGELDNRGSHAWLAALWAKELAEQTDDAELAEQFAPIAAKLEEAMEAIQQQLVDVQGSAVEIDGYYRPDEDKLAAVMRPSEQLNEIIDSLGTAN